MWKTKFPSPKCDSAKMREKERGLLTRQTRAERA
jgi:hypothetical protein